MLGERVQIRDINLRVLESPFGLQLARAVDSTLPPEKEARLGFHLAPKDLGDFFLTTIMEETSADIGDKKGKLMVCSGVQYGCSVRACPFCAYCQLPYYRNLTVLEIVDLFRLPLFVYSRRHDFGNDERQLYLKFTDDGESLENPLLPAALDKLIKLFGVKGKMLGIKVSSVFKDDQRSRAVFADLCRWQRENLTWASVHLQVSIIPGVPGLLSARETRDWVEAWQSANPYDKVYFAPGFFKGCNMVSFWKLCDILQGMRGEFRFRLSVIKSSSPEQREMALDETTLAAIRSTIEDFGFRVDPLPARFLLHSGHLQTVGTLSHLPGDGNFYDPATYQIWNFCPGAQDPNTPL